MLRGTRTQFLRRRAYFTVVLLPVLVILLSALVVGSTGRDRIFFAVSDGAFIIAGVRNVLRLTDKRWLKEQAKMQRRATAHGDGSIRLRGDYRPRAIAFAKRLFAKREPS
jgi:hypothetical protein